MKYEPPPYDEAMRFVLVIDTCGQTGYVALLPVGDEADRLVERILPGRETQELLMGAVGEVLAEAGTGLDDAAALAVVTGPGSFTGVRIGLAAVKGFAEALELPVIALSRLAVLAKTGTVAGKSGAVHAWLDAGRGDIFAGRYTRARAGLRLVDEAMVTRERATEQVLPGDSVFVAEAALAETFAAAVLVAEEALRRELLRMVTDAFARQAFADVALLDANYLRVPDAEVALRGRQGAELTGKVSSSEGVTFGGAAGVVRAS